jgi:hypothetical protein
LPEVAAVMVGGGQSNKKDGRIDEFPRERGIC